MCWVYNASTRTQRVGRMKAVTNGPPGGDPPKAAAYTTEGSKSAWDRTLDSRASNSFRQEGAGTAGSGIVREKEQVGIPPHLEGACNVAVQRARAGAQAIPSGPSPQPNCIARRRDEARKQRADSGPRGGTGGGSTGSRMVHRFATDSGGLVGYDKRRRVPRMVTRTTEDTMDKIPGRAAGRARAGQRDHGGRKKGHVDITSVNITSFGLNDALECLAQLAPDQIDAASKQNINFNMEVQQRGMELKKLKKLVLELERELDRLQHVGVGTDRAGSRDRQREFEEKLEECNSELRELCRRATGDSADALLAELEDELNNMRSLLEDNMDELEAARFAALEAANAELVARAEEETKQLRLENEDLRQQLQRAEAQERSESRAIILEEREEREAEDELEMKNAEIDDLVAEHERFVAVIEEKLRNCVMCSERESESKDLRLNVSELEANTDDLHSKFEAAPAYLEEETEAQDAEIESIQQTVDKLGECSRTRTTATARATRRPPSATVSRPSPLRSKTCKIAILKAELEITQLYEACSDEIQAHHDRQEELASHAEDLVAQRHAERAAAAQAAAAKEHAGALRAEHRILNTNESALQRVLAGLACTQALLAARDPDFTAVQAAFQALEGESHRAGETHSRPPQARFESHPQFDLAQKRNRRLNEVHYARVERALAIASALAPESGFADGRSSVAALGLATPTKREVNTPGKWLSIEEGITYKNSTALVSRAGPGKRLYVGNIRPDDPQADRSPIVAVIDDWCGKVIGTTVTNGHTVWARYNYGTFTVLVTGQAINGFKLNSPKPSTLDSTAKGDLGASPEKLIISIRKSRCEVAYAACSVLVRATHGFKAIPAGASRGALILAQWTRIHIRIREPAHHTYQLNAAPAQCTPTRYCVSRIVRLNGESWHAVMPPALSGLCACAPTPSTPLEHHDHYTSQDLSSGANLWRLLVLWVYHDADVSSPTRHGPPSSFFGDTRAPSLRSARNVRLVGEGARAHLRRGTAYVVQEVDVQIGAQSRAAETKCWGTVDAAAGAENSLSVRFTDWRFLAVGTHERGGDGTARPMLLCAARAGNVLFYIFACHGKVQPGNGRLVTRGARLYCGKSTASESFGPQALLLASAILLYFNVVWVWQRVLQFSVFETMPVSDMLAFTPTTGADYGGLSQI
ncbi:hypothetical protein FB451DRAFT_1182618 [Mycena latifolia]|nr:hypothetical protein FB451DRAFT_1182618 [Mycena latifolia]